MKGTKTHSLWIDIETTGLLPAADAILEIGAALFRNVPFERVDSREFIFPLPELRLAEIDDIVLEMHVKSGLWALCRKESMRSFDSAARLFTDWLSTIAVRVRNEMPEADHDTAYSLIVAGSGIVKFDLPFLQAQIPLAMNFFSPDVIDVAIIRHAIALWNPGVFDPVVEAYRTAKPHRALQDAILAAEMYAQYMTLFRPHA